MSISVLSIVLGGIYGVFEAATRSLKVVQEAAELTQTARVVLADLRQQLGSVYPLLVPLDEEQLAELGLDQTTTSDSAPQGVVAFAGESSTDQDGRPLDNVRFTTALTGANRGGRPRFDVAEMMYLIDIDPETPEEGLVRRVNYYPGLSTSDDPSLLEATVLTRLATSLRFRYWLGQDEEPYGDVQADEDGWYPSWSDPEKLPQAVEITLGLTPARPNAPEQQFRTIVRLPIRRPRPDFSAQDEDNQQPTQESTDQQQPPSGAEAAPSGLGAGGGGGQGPAGGGGGAGQALGGGPALGF